MKRFTLSFLYMLTIFSTPLLAQWDFSAQFSTTSNPNGVWSYGWGTGMNDFDTYNLHGPYGSGGSPMWIEEESDAATGPQMWKNTTGTLSYGIQPGEIAQHPSTTELCKVRWAKPSVSQPYLRLTGKWGAGHDGAGDFWIVKNASEILFTVHEVAGDVPFDLTVANSGLTTLDFIQGPGSSFGAENVPFFLIITPTSSAPVTFQDATTSAGLTGLTWGNTASWPDFDNDGWVDLYVNGQLWRNNGATDPSNVQFSLVAGTPLGGDGIWGDFDNDGFVDLFCWPAGLFHNNNGQSFTNVSYKIPPLPTQVSRGAVWGDWNGDGYLDLYVGGYETWEFPSWPDVILINTADPDEPGQRKFIITWQQSPEEVQGYANRARGVTAADWDQDNDLDIYVSNYRIYPNHLWRNDGTGHFIDVAATTHINARNTDLDSVYAGGHSVGACWGDFNNDGLLDIFAGNFAHDIPPDRADQPQSRFLRNRGASDDYRFDDLGQCGVTYQESYGSPAVGDYDNDGNLDLFFDTYYAIASYGIPNYPTLFRNNGNWTFTDVNSQTGVGGLGPTSQASWADYNNDGCLDLFSCGKLFKNNGGSSHWLKVHLASKDPAVNASAIGTQVRVLLGSQTLTRQVEGATGEGNQNELTLHFGLGANAGPVNIEIRWPDGQVQTQSVPVDQTLQIVRPAPLLQSCSQMTGFLTADLDTNCYVDFRDFFFLTTDWLNCTELADENCDHSWYPHPGMDWNLARDFSTESAQSGAWSYGYGATLAKDDFVVFQTFGYDAYENSPAWYVSVAEGPILWKNTSSSAAFGIAPGEVGSHPSFNMLAKTRWQSHLNATIHISGSFGIGHSGACDLWIVKDGTETLLFAEETNANIPVNLNIAVQPDTTIDFVHGRGDSWGCESVPLNITITVTSINYDPLEWNLLADFSTETATPKLWKYGYGASLAKSDFTLHQNFTYSGTNPVWYVDMNLGPNFWKNASSTSIYGVAPGQVASHPGPALLAKTRWQSDANYQVHAFGSFGAGDSGACDIWIIKDGREILCSAEETNSQVAFNLTTTAQPGTTLDFVHGPGDSFWGESVPLDITIDATLDNDCASVGVYPAYDINQDCYTDLGDMAVFASQWLLCSDPANIDCLAHPYFLAYWQLDETAGASAADSVGGHPGTLKNFPADNSQWKAGKVGGALQFDGVNDYVEATGFKGITGTEPRTCAAWIKTTYGGEIVSWGLEQYSQKWIMRIQETDGALRVEVQGGSVYGTADLRDGNWHHVAAVWADDGTPNVEDVILYIDGQRETIDTATPYQINTGVGANVKIGVFQAATYARYFQGLIDDVRIYGKALSPAEIAELANP